MPMPTTLFSPKDLHARYVALPDRAKDFLSEEGAAAVTRIERAHRLHVDQAGVLYRIMMATAVGLLPAHQFVATVRRELGLSNDDAKEIAKEVNREIFIPLRELLRPRPPQERAAGAAPPLAEEAPLDPVAVGTPRTPLLQQDTGGAAAPPLETQRLSSVASLPARERTVAEVRAKLPPRGSGAEGRARAAQDPYREPIE